MVADMASGVRGRWRGRLRGSGPRLAKSKHQKKEGAKANLPGPLRGRGRALAACTMAGGHGPCRSSWLGH